ADEQLKVRGFRIEPGEIELVLEQQETISHAAVVARDQVLVAYVVPASGRLIDVDALRRALAARLPDYMVPSAFATLERMPMTPNGKLDRRALPSPEWAPLPTREPGTRNEMMLRDLFADVLALEQVGMD